MEKNPKTVSTANKWAERLRGRTRMAVAAIGGVFLLGFFVVSRPLSQRIDAANDRLSKAESRMMLASDVFDLRKQASHYKKKIPQGADLNDWTNYLLSGVRTQHVKLVKMEPKKAMTLGPCKVLTWHMEMMGDFESVAKVVQWMENGERLVRIDKIVFQMKGDKLTTSMVVKGIVLDMPPEKKPKPPKEAKEIQASTSVQQP